MNYVDQGFFEITLYYTIARICSAGPDLFGYGMW